MSALSNAKGEPTDPIRGIVNDLFDALGVPRFEQFLGVPADIAHALRMPTLHEALPTPAEVGASVTRSFMTGQPLRIPAPLLPSGPIPAPFDRSLMRPGGMAPSMDKGQETPFMPLPPLPPLPGYAHGPYYQGMYYQERKQ